MKNKYILLILLLKTIIKITIYIETFVMKGKVTDFLVKVTIGILFVFGIALIFAISAAGILLFNAIASTANAPIADGK